MDYVFNGRVAEIYGVAEAVFIHNLYWWIAKNEANGRHYYDGRNWTYNSMDAFTKLFPFWTVGQIRRIINKLKFDGALHVGNYNYRGFDRTQWYALDESVTALYKSTLPICQNEHIHLSKTANGCVENDRPIPDINTDINTDNNISSNSTESDNSVSVQEWFDKTYAEYPRHDGKTKGYVSYKAYLKNGRKIAGCGTVRLNHHQMLIAVRCYADEMQGKDKQYIQLFSTYMHSTILDYCEKTKEDYEDFMREKYGEGWQKIKFEYRE